MEYEKIILELLVRVKNLEEQVAILSAEGKSGDKKQAGTADIRNYISDLKEEAARNGLTHLVLKANDIHKDLGLKSRMPAVCNAMKQSMKPGDTVLHETNSGFSSTYEVKYLLD